MIVSENHYRIGGHTVDMIEVDLEMLEGIMNFKDEMKRDMRNAMKDIEKEVDRTWAFTYKGHEIKVINRLMEEHLLIDGVIVASNRRKSFWSHIMPHSKLVGELVLEDGTKHKVTVKLGGYVRLRCIVKVDNEVILEDALKLEFLPWDNKEKIVDYLRRQFDQNSQSLDASLPDDEYVYDENHPRMAAGLADQLTNEAPTPFYVNRLIALFEEQMKNPNTKTRRATYEKILSDQIASYREALIEKFLQSKVSEQLIKQEALWLLEHATHREVVKFAITMLAFTDCNEHKDLLMLIGRHEEFTPYVIFALKNGVQQANEHIWILAKSLHGWGRITAVTSLDATSQEIKYWLLTEGCENHIMNEYLSLTCATKGELDVALYEETILKELYEGAAVIIKGLLSKSGLGQIEEYPYAGAVLSRFVHHAKEHCNTLEDFYPLLEIGAYVQVDEDIWEERYRTSWKPYERKAIEEGLVYFLDDAKWRTLAIDRFKEDGDFTALQIASFYKADVISIIFDKFPQSPLNVAYYLEIMHSKNPQYIEQLCQFAEKQLIGDGIRAEQVDCMHIIIQDLHQYEGLGIPILQAALASTYQGLHYHALHALTAWQSTDWRSAEMIELIQKLEAESEDEDISQLAKAILEK